MSKIFTSLMFMVLCVAPLSAFSDPVPPVFFTPSDLDNYIKSTGDEAKAIEIGTVLCDETGPTWDKSKIWFDDHYKIIIQGYDLTATDVYLNVHDIEMARRMIVALPDVKSLTILCHAYCYPQNQESFKPLIAAWAKKQKKLTVNSLPDDSGRGLVMTCFLFDIGMRVFEGFDPDKAAGLQRDIKKCIDQKLQGYANAGVKVSPEDSRTIEKNLREKLLIKAACFCVPNMHTREKQDIVKMLLAYQEEWSDVFQRRLVKFIQKRSEVWQQRTPRSEQDDYEKIIDTLFQLNEEEVDLLLTKIETDFNHVIENSAPFVNLIAQILYPERFKSHDSLYEGAGKERPTKGIAANLRKYEACLKAFPLIRMDDAAALRLIENYFVNPIDAKFYGWGVELYEFGAELGQQFAALPDSKQEDAFLLAKAFKDNAFSKVTPSDHDDDEREPEMFSKQVLDDWVSVLKIICFIVKEIQESPGNDETVTTLAGFYATYNRLPFSLADFRVFLQHERLQVMQKISPLFDLLKIKRDEVSLLLDKFKKLRDWNQGVSDDEHREYLKIIWPVFAHHENELEHFLVSLPFDQRTAFLTQSRSVLEYLPTNWKQTIKQIMCDYKKSLTAEKQPVPSPVKKGLFGNLFAKKPS